MARINEVANGNVSAFGREVAAAAETLAAARTSLADAVNSLAGMAVDLRTGLAGARDGLAAAERAGGVFATAGSSIGEATRHTQEVVSRLGERLHAEAAVIESHKALAAQLEQRVVPALERAFVNYTRAVEEQSRKLQDGWQQLAERVKHTVEACGAGLQDSVQQLVEQVDLLKRQLDRSTPAPRRP
jgi:ABC-type transporter Mla subunit MlaD